MCGNSGKDVQAGCTIDCDFAVKTASGFARDFRPEFPPYTIPVVLTQGVDRMLRILTTVALAAVFTVPAFAEEKKVTGPLSYTLKDIKGNPVELSKYKGKVVMLVNVASQCGLT